MVISTVFYGILLILLGYLLLRSLHQRSPVVPVAHVPSLRAPASPLQEVKEWVQSLLPKSPNRYGFGGMDPSGGLRKGGDGRGIPREVDVGWWNGEISYPERELSPIVDSEEIPAPQVHSVGWWGDDILSQ